MRRGLKPRVHRIVAAPRRTVTPTAPLPDMAIPFVDRQRPPAPGRRVGAQKK